MKILRHVMPTPGLVLYNWLSLLTNLVRDYLSLAQELDCNIYVRNACIYVYISRMEGYTASTRLTGGPILVQNSNWFSMMDGSVMRVVTIAGCRWQLFLSTFYITPGLAIVYCWLKSASMKTCAKLICYRRWWHESTTNWRWLFTWRYGTWTYIEKC